MDRDRFINDTFEVMSSEFNFKDMQYIIDCLQGMLDCTIEEDEEDEEEEEDF